MQPFVVKLYMFQFASKISMVIGGTHMIAITLPKYV